MCGYKDATARNAGKQYFTTNNFQFDLSSIQFATDDIRDELYPLVKTVPEFEGSKDV
jgi:hypothetical protein